MHFSIAIFMNLVGTIVNPGRVEQFKILQFSLDDYCISTCTLCDYCVSVMWGTVVVTKYKQNTNWN